MSHFCRPSCNIGNKKPYYLSSTFNQKSILILMLVAFKYCLFLTNAVVFAKKQLTFNEKKASYFSLSVVFIRGCFCGNKASFFDGSSRFWSLSEVFKFSISGGFWYWEIAFLTLADFQELNSTQFLHQFARLYIYWLNYRFRCISLWSRKSTERNLIKAQGLKWRGKRIMQFAYVSHRCH